MRRVFRRNALLDYVEMVCKQISKRFVEPPDWWTPPTKEVSAPSLRKPGVNCFEDNKTGNSRLCVRCQEEADEEERAQEEEREKEQMSKKDKVAVRKQARERMKRKADEAKRKKEEAQAAKKMKK